MSVKKIDRNGEQETNIKSAVDSPGFADLAVKIRRLMHYHANMGVNTYPLTPEMSRFLAPEKKKEGIMPQHLLKLNEKENKPPSSPRNGVDVRTVLQELEFEMRGCTLCKLSGSRQGIVAGKGGDRPALMVVGNWSQQEGGLAEGILFAPEEDAMLVKMMQAIGLDPRDIYVTNTVKCCPSSSEMPGKAEEQACFPFLIREIAAIRPRLICAMGEAAARLLVDSSEPLIRLRGRFYSYRYADDQALMVLPTFHPRFLLAHPEMKKATWHDLQMIQQRLAAR